MKKIGIIATCMLLVFVTCVGCGKKNKDSKDKDIKIEGKKKINQSEGIVNSKEVDGYKFENTTFVTVGEDTSFITYMTNTNADAPEIDKVNVSMLDSEDREIVNIDINVLRSIASNETLELSTMLSSDLSNVKTINYKVIKAE